MLGGDFLFLDKGFLDCSLDHLLDLTALVTTQGSGYGIDVKLGGVQVTLCQVNGHDLFSI